MRYERVDRTEGQLGLSFESIEEVQDACYCNNRYGGGLHSPEEAELIIKLAHGLHAVISAARQGTVPVDSFVFEGWQKKYLESNLHAAAANEQDNNPRRKRAVHMIAGAPMSRVMANYKVA